MATLGMAVLLPLNLAFPSFAQPQIITVVASTSGNITALSRSSLPLFSICWLGGTLIVLLRFLVGVVYFARRMRSSVQGSYSSAEGLPVLFADVPTPVLWGWFRPRILMPLSATHWSTQRKQIAIAHELAHYHRRDNWTTLVAVGARSLYWFHPLVWWLATRAEEQRELACDDRVLLRGTSTSEYAALLVDIARQHSSPVSFGCAMFHNTNHLKGRLMHILHFRNPHFPQRNRFAVASAISAMFLGCLLIPASASQQKIYKIGGDVSAPKVLYKTEPGYAPQPKRDKVQGSVLLGVVINTHGRAQNIHVIRSLNTDLDKNAMKSVAKWKFQPATKDGKSVPVMANIEVNFRLL
jgi:TonB family protein